MQKLQLQSQSVADLDDAAAVLAKWRRIPGFVFGYAVADTSAIGDKPSRVQGLFDLDSEPRFANGQRVVWVSKATSQSDAGRATTISEAISALQNVLLEHGDLPIGGEAAHVLKFTVCDAQGCEVGKQPAHDVFIEAW